MDENSTRRRRNRRQPPADYTASPVQDNETTPAPQTPSRRKKQEVPSYLSSSAQRPSAPYRPTTDNGQVQAPSSTRSPFDAPPYSHSRVATPPREDDLEIYRHRTRPTQTNYSTYSSSHAPQRGNDAYPIKPPAQNAGRNTTPTPRVGQDNTYTYQPTPSGTDGPRRTRPSQDTSAPKSTRPAAPRSTASDWRNMPPADSYAKQGQPTYRQPTPQQFKQRNTSDQNYANTPPASGRAPRNQGASARNRAASGGYQGESKPTAKRGKGIPRYMRLLITFVLIIGLASGGILGYAYLSKVKQTLDLGNNVFYPNLYINNIALGGMTKDQALLAVTAQVEQTVNSFAINLSTPDGQSWQVNKDTLSMTYDVTDQVNQLWRLGREGNASQRYDQIQTLLKEPVLRYTSLSYDITGVSSLLVQVKSQVDRAPADAQRIKDDTTFPPYTYTDESIGYSLDVSAAYTEICGMIDRLESGNVSLTPTVLEPTITRASLESQVVKIASYETEISSRSTQERTSNVALGASKFNNMTVTNNTRVSFNSVTGKRTERNGYLPALEIANGEYRMGIGGGICQVSTTLYNACITAGLEILTRHQHGLVVGYIDKGLDATVADSGKDLVFRNNTGADIYIQAGVEIRGKRQYCVFNIYGRPDTSGNTYKLDGRVTEIIPVPEEILKVDTDKDGDGIGDTHGLVFMDETVLASKGDEGYKIDTYLITSQGGVPISEEFRYTDTFKPIAPVRYTGAYSRD